MAQKKISPKKSLHKAPAKKGLLTESKTARYDVMQESLVSSSKTMSPSLKRNKFLIGATIAVFVVLLLAAAYYYKSIFIVATVNGQPITRLAIIHELEKQGGKQTLNSLVTQTLISQEAQKRNISVSQEEIDVEIKKINAQVTKQGQKLETLLAAQNRSLEDFKEQIRIQKLVEKMLGKDVQVTDQEVIAYLEKNKDSIPQDTDQNKLKAQIKEQLKQQKLSEKVQALIQSLQQKANIRYFVNY